MVDVCIVGAGVAGLTAAQHLQGLGHEVLVLEKSRSFGGRAATRTIQGNRVDHGAQHFTVRDKRLQHVVEQWLQSGDVVEWTQGFHRLDKTGTLHAPQQGHSRYICPAGMNSLGKLLAKELEVKRETRVMNIRSAAGVWELELDNGKTQIAKRLVINTPASQALELCQNINLDDVQAALAAVQFDPCFALMAGYKKACAPAWFGVNIEQPSPLAWIAHDSSKRGEPKQTVLVLHSSPGFARQHFGTPPEQVIAMMLGAASVLGDWMKTPLWSDSQRWRYALTSQAYPKPYLRYQHNLFFCGDWCGGARLEAAYLSGIAVGKAVSKVMHNSV